MLREVDEDIWVAEQPLRYFGLSVGTRMTVIRLTNQELVVISPIQVDSMILTQLSKLGDVRHIIAPNLYHYMFAAGLKDSYPDSTFWAVPGLNIKNPDLPIDKIISDSAVQFWDGLEFLFFEGFRVLDLNGFSPINECIFFHLASRTLVLTDTAFHFDESFPLLTQFATRVFGGYKCLSPSVLEKIASTDKEKVKKSAEQVLHWDFRRVIMAHGTVIEEEGKERFKQGYEKFLGQSLSVVA